MHRLSVQQDTLTAIIVAGAIAIVLAAVIGRPEFLVLGLFLLGLGGFLRVFQRTEHKVAAEYQRYAMAHGFQFEARWRSAEEASAGVVILFAKSHAHYWHNEISGEIDGIPFSSFEYEYTSYGRDHTCAVMHWPVETNDFPRFTLDPQVSDVVGYVFGLPDIVFGADPRFSALYSLKGPDTAAVAALFPSSVRRFFVVHQGQHMAGDGHDLFWWRDRSLPPPEQMDEFLAEGNSIRKLFVHDGDAVTEDRDAGDDDQDTETEHHIYVNR
jgi:hypothetical protein